MASIGLRIRQPGNIGVNVSGLADSLASAFFGDANTEMALAKMRSQLATDAYQRQQMWQASELNRAKRETEEQNLRWRQGAVDPLGKVLFDAQGRPVASDTGPAPVVLPESTQAIPQLRPSDAADYVPPTSYASTEPDVQVSPANYPLRSDQPAPVAAGPGGVEPDMSFGAYGVPAGGPALPPTAPVPLRRPGDIPLLPTPLDGVPPDLLPGAQAAPVNTVRPERAGDLRPTIVDSGSPSTFPVRPELPGSLAPTGQPMPDLYSSFGPRPAQIGSNVFPYRLPEGAVPATGESFLTLGDLWNHLIGQPPRRPEFDQPVSFGGDSGPATPFYNEEGLRNLIANGGREGTRANAQLIPPDRPSIWSAPGPFPARPGAPDMAGPVPIDLQPRPPMETGRRPGNFPPFEPNQALEGPPPPQLRPALPPGAYPSPALTGVPSDLLPTPVDVPLPGYVLNEGLPQDVPPELTPMTGGTSVAVPGRNPPMPDTRPLAGVPPELRGPAQPGGPAVTVPGRTSQETVRDRPPPVSPDYPIAPDAYPVSATGDVILEPSTQTVVVHTQSGGPVRLTIDEARAIAGGIMGSSTSGADLASGTGKMAGLLGLTYGDPNNPDRQRISSELYTGNTPTTSTMVTSQDTAPATFEAQKAAATAAANRTDPTKAKENIQVIKDVPYQIGRDSTGNITLTPIPTGGGAAAGGPITIPDLIQDNPGTAAETGYGNMVADIAEMYRRKMPIDPAIAALYAQDYQQLYGNQLIQDVDPITGNRRDRVVQKPAPTGMPSPEEIFTAAGGAPAPAGGAPAAAPAGGGPAQPNAPAAPTGAAAGTSPAPPPAAGETPASAPGQPVLVRSEDGTVTYRSHRSKVNGNEVPNYGGWSGDGETAPVRTTTDELGGFKITERQTEERKTKAIGEDQKTYELLMEAIPVAKYLDSLGPDRAPGVFDFVTNHLSDALQNAGPTGLTLEGFAELFRDPEQKRYARALFTFINAKARPDTGAAVTYKEWQDYENRFAMKPGADTSDYLDTRARRTDALRAMRLGLNGRVDAESLKRMDMLMATHGAGENALDLDWTQNAQRKKYEESKQSSSNKPPRFRQKQGGGFEEVPAQ